MNSAEKKFLCLALFLFTLGWLSRFGLFNELSPLENVSLPVNAEIAADSATLADSIIAAIDSVLQNDEEQNNEVSASDKPVKHGKPKKKAPAFPLSINTASADDLCFIKGVGPSLAQKIIDYRETKGPFRSAKDLEKVSGVGAKKRQAIEEFVKFD
jgi:competence protein ComEA